MQTRKLNETEKRDFQQLHSTCRGTNYKPATHRTQLAYLRVPTIFCKICHFGTVCSVIGGT